MCVCKWMFAIIQTFLIVENVKAARILILSVHLHSHMHESLSIGEELRTRGHDVDIVLNSVTTVPRVTSEVGIGVIKYKSSFSSNIFESDWFSERQVNSFFSPNAKDHMAFFKKMKNISSQECIDMMSDSVFMDEVRARHFDIAIVDRFPLAICLPILPISLEIPFVSLASHYDYWLMRVPSLPSSSQFSFLIADRDYRGLFSRLRNTLILFYMLNFVEGDSNDPSNFLIREHAKTTVQQQMTWVDIQRSAEIFFINLEPVLDSVFPLMPNTITVGGLTCKPANTIPIDVKAIMDSAEHGVVLFASGSVVNHLPIDVKLKLATAFGKIKQMVIWKFKGQATFPVPSNVKLMSWVPQNDILGHHKTRLFITHSGNNGQYEAIYHAVPMLAFYLFADQEYNSMRIEAKGFGERFSLNNFTTEDMIRRIERVISNPKYKETIVRASKVYHNQPMNARQKAAYWIEHVIKYGGKHLRPVEIDMPWYQYTMLDVIIVIVTISIILISILLIMIYFVVRLLCGRVRKLKRKLD